mgnify:CR=1 FL=1
MVNAVTTVKSADMTQQVISSDDNSLLIVDDDSRFADRLARAMEKRGFSCLIATTKHEFTMPFSSLFYKLLSSSSDL